MFQCTYNGFVLQYYQLTCIILLYMDIQYHFSAVPALLLHQRGAAPLFFSLWSRTVLMWWEMFLMWLWTSLKSDIWLDFITMCFFFVFFPPSCHSECFVCFNRGIRDDGRKFNKTNKQKKADLKFENTTNFIFFWGGGDKLFFLGHFERQTISPQKLCHILSYQKVIMLKKRWC